LIENVLEFVDDFKQLVGVGIQLLINAIGQVKGNEGKGVHIDCT
jgi:hypothetical protein